MKKKKTTKRSKNKSSLLSLIVKKRDGGSLTKTEIQSFVDELSSHPDYQVASFLAFIFCRGLSEDETAYLTEAMRFSGEQLERKSISKEAFIIDKHSTGGVGDKISIPLAPLLVACSEIVHIPMIAGRSLGHTGGTVDKLESIPGLKTSFPKGRYQQLLKKNRMVFSGQSARVAPADQKLYALRDVTGTVPSIELIVASILSKKLSASLDYLLFDVKFGTGAFMKNLDSAEDLAMQLLRVAKLNGLKACAVMTSMNAPLGRYAGNSLEIKESIEILKGCGPKDSTLLTTHFAGKLLQQAGLSLSEAETAIKTALESGRAYEVFEKCVAAQSGELNKFLTKSSKKLRQKVFKAKDSGSLTWDVEGLGWGLNFLGAGRLEKSDKIDHDLGFEFIAPSFSKVSRGDPLLSIYYKDADKLKRAEKKLSESCFFHEKNKDNESLIRKHFET